MTQAKQAYTPSMASAVVKARTGKDWAGGFEALDKASTAKRGTASGATSC